MSGILVHEWLSPEGGSENVFATLCEMFPDAERWALWDASEGRFAGIHETLLARTPLRGQKAAALPFMPAVWRALPSRSAEWVLCSTHAFAHHARFHGPARDAPKFVYAHTPARYVWAPELDGRGGGAVARGLSSLLKRVDRARAQEPTAIAANSDFVADRIARCWEREASVIHPPIAVDEFGVEPDLDSVDERVLDNLPTGYLLGFSRFVPYKRLDAVIDAGRAVGLPVVLAGAGPDEQRLRAIADERHPGRVTFVHRPSAPLLRALYRHARALVFAPVEDFGIVPVEAMASGTPVVANAVGGAAESVVVGETGTLVREWNSPSEVREAVERAVSMDSAACVRRARDFSPEVFEQNMRGWLQTRLDGRALTA
ncbi:glycosyltransferase [Microbacterium sp.]|uniref:glycosyltransferase n=1 Tax=Microbacterium sp. TaxID=51671 RepID=UPI003A876370